jgi:hypothetical protein
MLYKKPDFHEKFYSFALYGSRHYVFWFRNSYFYKIPLIFFKAKGVLKSEMLMRNCVYMVTLIMLVKVIQMTMLFF